MNAMRILSSAALICAACIVQPVSAEESAAAASAGAGLTADAYPALSAIQGDHISISVENLDKEIEWYGRVLGFKEVNRMNRPPSMTNVNLRNGSYRIDLIKYAGSKRTPADPVYLQQGYVHLALSVPDLAAARAALMKLDPDVKPGAGIAIVLKDPEGNEIEIFARK
jgi:catechol 2,3-dioxygenase-like lactoylglutathione lyase family enzyme